MRSDRIDTVYRAIRARGSGSVGCTAEDVSVYLNRQLTATQVYNTIQTLEKRGKIRMVGTSSRRHLYKVVELPWYRKLWEAIRGE